MINIKEFISFGEVSKVYQMGEPKIQALDKVSFQINKGILGASGTGENYSSELDW